METTLYLEKFGKSADRLDRNLLNRHKMDYKVGVWVQSVALKMQKKSWADAAPTARPFEGSIFFSVWVSDESIRESELHYNIHAFKLRQLAGYKIQSREFAAAFRARFKAFEKKWPNVRVDFGPLTLMEGWIGVDLKNFDKELVDLAHRFLEIHFIIDDLLEERRR
jgi:hypothetical protein